MKCLVLVFLSVCLSVISVFAQAQEVISKEDFLFLEKMTRDVLDTSKIRPGQSLPAPFGKNNTGGTLVRPGGRDTYPSFWIRDYAMSLETGFVTAAEQKHMLTLTAASQCDQTWITKGGSMVPFGVIPDHIRVDDLLPIYFPGTYSYEDQGVKEFGMFPPYDDQFYFIQMAYYYVGKTNDIAILKKEINGRSLLERLETAFVVPPSRLENQIVFTNETFRGVDFGFRDAIEITGELCYTSLLKYAAANQLTDIFGRLHDKKKAQHYSKIASKIKASIPGTFLNANGMLRASTGKSQQPDVWATAIAIDLGLLEGEDAIKACRFLATAYQQGTLAYKGSIRHVLTTEDYSDKTAWESALVPKNTYQNGSYWGTPTGWVVRAIAKAAPELAMKLAKEYVNELRENDFRKGPQFGSPQECFFGTSDKRGPVYLTTVSCPYVSFRKLVTGK